MFKNPIAPRIKETKAKNPWNYQAPCYDERNMISAGDSYGVGFNQPIGHKGNPKQNVDGILPRNKTTTMRDDNIPEAKLDMYGKNKNSQY